MPVLYELVLKPIATSVLKLMVDVVKGYLLSADGKAVSLQLLHWSGQMENI